MSGFKLGDLICKSKPYVYVLSNEFRGVRCDYCFIKGNGLKRCGQCTFTYYCGKNCQMKAWEDIHKTECKFIKNAKPKLPTPSLRILAHILFKIKKHGEDEPFEIIHGHKMTFRRLVSHKEKFLQNTETLEKDKPMMTLFEVLKSYLGQQNVPDLFKYTEIFGKMSVNTFSICDGEMQSIGTGMYLGASIFDHSCEPNAEVVFDGTDLQVQAVKEIPHKDVTKIYISYIEQIQLLEDRKRHFIEHYYFECKCVRCITSKYEDLMTKTFTSKEESESLLVEFKEKTEHVKQMKKNNATPAIIYDYCMTELARLDDKLADTHIFRIKLLEHALDSCIDSNQWADAIVIGKQLIEPYRLLYGEYQPAYGVLLFKIGKIQNLQGLFESASANLTKAERTLRITHGTDHPLYKDLMTVMFECQFTL